MIDSLIENKVKATKVSPLRTGCSNVSFISVDTNNSNKTDAIITGEIEFNKWFQTYENSIMNIGCHYSDYYSYSVSFPQITRTEEIVTNIIESINMSDISQLLSIEKLCPNWKENIRFAMSTNHDDQNLFDAIDNIQSSWRRVKYVRMLMESILIHECMYSL